MRVVVVNSESMGRGDEELGKLLIPKFLNTLCKCETKPDVILFYNSGVKLLTQAGAIQEALKTLEEAGVELIACGTCVSYFGLQDRILVGRVSSMDEIVATMMKADSVVTI
jgi:selenium metabolism protein YedF